MPVKDKKFVRKVLRRLRYVAENVIDYRHMNMQHWLLHKGLGPNAPGALTPHLKKDGTPDPMGCGTTACFLGWALTDTRFRKITGLRLGIREGALSPYYKPETKYGSMCEGKIAAEMGISGRAFSFLFGAYKSGKKRHLLARLKVVEKDPLAEEFPDKK